MDEAGAITIIDKMIECIYNECCECDCEKCPLFVSNEDQIKALVIAIAALKRN